jgi:hypothetical protein
MVSILTLTAVDDGCGTAGGPHIGKAPPPSAISPEWQYAATAISAERDREWDKDHNPSGN